MALYPLYSFKLILSFWVNFSTKLVQIMTQEFAKTPILGQLGRIRPRSFPRKNQKKLAFFFIFVLSSFLKKRQFPIILSSLQQPHRVDLLSLDQMGQWDSALIRVRRHDNKCKETQVAVSEVIITIVFNISKACYKTNNLYFAYYSDQSNQCYAVAAINMTPEETTIQTLRWWSQLLLWVSIVLPSLGALAAGARYYVERHEKQLSSRVTNSAIQRATQDAAAACSELSEFKEKTAPRHLLPEQRKALLSAFAALKGRPVAFASRLMDGESCDYAMELATLALEAGCQVGEPIKTSVNDLPGYLAIVSHGKADRRIAEVLSSAFDTAAIPAKIEAIKENSVGVWYPDEVHVIVGRKSP